MADETNNPGKGFLGHASDFGSTMGSLVWGGIKDTASMAVSAGQYVADSQFGQGVQDIEHGLEWLTGEEIDVPDFLPNADRARATEQHLKDTAYAIYENPGAVWESVKKPYVDAYQNGDWGKLAAQGLYDVGGLFVGTKGLDKLGRIAKIGKVLGELRDLTKIKGLVGDMRKLGALDELVAGARKAGPEQLKETLKHLDAKELDDLVKKTVISEAERDGVKAAKAPETNSDADVTSQDKDAGSKSSEETDAAPADEGGADPDGSDSDANGATKAAKPVKATPEDYLNPKPNTLYESNGYLYRTDADGRLIEASGELRLNKAPRNSYQQGKVGKSSGVAGDEGGHMIGAQFDGLGEGPLHMVPQAMELNRGAGSKWSAMERGWADALDRGDKVNMKIDVEWPAGAKRPDGFRVTHEVTDVKTGISTQVKEYFPNP